VSQFTVFQVMARAERAPGSEAVGQGHVGAGVSSGWPSTAVSRTKVGGGQVGDDIPCRWVHLGSLTTCTKRTSCGAQAMPGFGFRLRALNAPSCLVFFTKRPTIG
jgi:hypothetical protein